LGVAVVNNNLFIGDGSKWIGIGGGVSLSQMNDSLANYMKSIYRRSDSVFYRRGGVEVFAYKDSVGAGGSITSGNGVNIWGGHANLGPLAGNVNIDGTFDYQEGANTPLGNREIYASAIKLQAAGGASQFDMDGGGMSISGDVYAPGTGTLTDTSGYFPVLMNRSNGKFQKLPWSLLPSGGGGGLDSAGVRSIVSDSVKTMVSGEGIVFDELSPDSIKVSVDTAWLSAKLDSVRSLSSSGYTEFVAYISQSGTDDPVLTVLHNTTGATMTASRSSAGVYVLTSSSSVFTIGLATPGVSSDYTSTINLKDESGTTTGFYQYHQIDNVSYSIRTFDAASTPSDSIFDSPQIIHIKIYQ
jgi:hypothetical protein